MNSLSIRPITEKDFRTYLTNLDKLPSDEIDFDDVNTTAIGFFLFQPERLELEQELNDVLDKHRHNTDGTEWFYKCRDELKTKTRDIRAELAELNVYTASKHQQEYEQLIEDIISQTSQMLETKGFHFMLPILTHYLTKFRKTLESYN